jgi:ATP-binding protein involved in chromosome partitioning
LQKSCQHELKVPLLGQIPLVQSICDGGDSGHPIVLEENTPASMAFMTVAGNLAQQVAIRNATMQPTNPVQAAGY